MHPDLIEAHKQAYAPSEMSISHFQEERESKEYGACTFEMSGLRILFRTAKITPTKVGQFVTLWKRIGEGPIMPYDIADPFDLVIVSVRNVKHFGQFVFTKKILCDKGIISSTNHEGKRAMRVYPSWDHADNATAKKTQKWQLDYFYEIDPLLPVEPHRVKELFYNHIFNIAYL